jgi:very-short-patch-repair endonuclease
VIDLIWGIYGLPKPEKEYRFHPTRKWRFDFAWPNRKVAVEIEGGIWNRGAHVRGAHFLSDCEKYNSAGALGWRVFRFVPQQLKKGEAQAFMKGVFEHHAHA